MSHLGIRDDGPGQPPCCRGNATAVPATSKTAIAAGTVVLNRPPITRGTDSSNPSPSSGESVSLPHPLSKVENPAFRAGVRGWLGDRVGRDAQGFPLRANRRQYLCRAIFQYRSAADVGGENAKLVPTKSGLLWISGTVDF